MNIECDVRLLDTERQNLMQSLGAINTAIGSFISISKEACQPDIWTGDVEKTYYELIDNIVENFAKVSDHYTNINFYLTSVVNNYVEMQRSINRSVESMLK